LNDFPQIFGPANLSAFLRQSFGANNRSNRKPPKLSAGSFPSRFFVPNASNYALPPKNPPNKPEPTKTGIC
jgi:hypothetical protein